MLLFYYFNEKKERKERNKGRNTLLRRKNLLYYYIYALHQRKKERKKERKQTNKMACAPSEDSDQPGYSPSLIRVFTVRMKKAWDLTERTVESSDQSGQRSFCWFSHEAAHILQTYINFAFIIIQVYQFCRSYN